MYEHIDPETKEIVYIGKGSGGRAWDVTRARNNRRDHQEWMLKKMEQGYIPCDWVKIISKNLSNKQALEVELNRLHTFGLTRFNLQTGEKNHQSKLSNKQAIEIYRRVQIEKPVDLAKEYNVSKAAIYHIKNRTQWKIVTAGVNI